MTFAGLYCFVAEYQLHHFGSYRSTGSFIAPLFLLWLPVRWIAPKFWRRPTARWSQKRAVSASIAFYAWSAINDGELARGLLWLDAELGHLIVIPDRLLTPEQRARLLERTADPWAW